MCNLILLYCALSLAAQCIVIGPVCRRFCNGRAGGRCLLPRQLEITCIDLHQTGHVGEGSDRLQLIKFWRSGAPGKGGCGGANIFGCAYYSARAVFASLWALFFITQVDRFYIILMPGRVEWSKKAEN